MDQGSPQQSGDSLKESFHPATEEGLAAVAAIRQMLTARGGDLGLSYAERRAGMQAFADSRALPDGVVMRDHRLGGIRTRIVAPAAGGSGDCLFLHGGAFVLGSPETHAGLAARIALAADMRVHAIDYRLAPEHPFPAAIQDCVAAAEALGLEAERFAMIGDSAGGGLALAAACRLRGRATLPYALMLLAPWVDHRLTAASIAASREVDLVLNPEGLARDSAAYRGNVDSADPRVSILLDDLSNLPPTLIQVGEHEMLRDDASALARSLHGAGGDVALQVFGGMIHGFYAFAAPESKLAIGLGADWLSRKNEARW